MYCFLKYFWIIAFSGLCVFTSGCAGTTQGSNQNKFAWLNPPDAIVDDAGANMDGETSNKDYNSEHERYFHLGVYYQHIRH